MDKLRELLKDNEYSRIKELNVPDLLDEYTDAFIEFMNYADRKTNPNWDFDTNEELYRKARKLQKEIYRRCGYKEEE